MELNTRASRNNLCLELDLNTGVLAAGFDQRDFDALLQ